MSVTPRRTVRRRRRGTATADRAGSLCGRAAAALLCAVLLLTGGARPALRALIATTHADADDEAQDTIQAPSRVRIENGRTELVLSAAAERNAGIATARPVPAAERTQVQAYGEVLDATTLTDLASRYRSAAAQVVAAQARARASRAALVRVRSLYRDRRNMSAAQLQAAESASQADEAALTAAQGSLAALGADIAQRWGPVLASAVTHDGSLLRSIAARREFLVSVTLPAGVALASAPRAASAQLPDGASIGLALVSAATTVDPLVQGLRYYYSAPATSGLLAGLSVPVSLAAVPREHAALLVPESAVIWLQGKPWIYRLLGAPRRAPSSDAARQPGERIYVRESIAPERQTGNGGYLVRGLAPDAQIVVRGAQLLLSEEFRAQVEKQADD